MNEQNNTPQEKKSFWAKLFGSKSNNTPTVTTPPVAVPPTDQSAGLDNMDATAPASQFNSQIPEETSIVSDFPAQTQETAGIPALETESFETTNNGNDTINDVPQPPTDPMVTPAYQSPIQAEAPQQPAPESIEYTQPQEFTAPNSQVESPIVSENTEQPLPQPTQQPEQPQYPPQNPTPPSQQ